MNLHHSLHILMMMFYLEKTGIRLIITILILIISILSYQEVRKHHYGWDTMDFNDNVRKDFNYG